MVDQLNHVISLNKLSYTQLSLDLHKGLGPLFWACDLAWGQLHLKGANLHLLLLHSRTLLHPLNLVSPPPSTSPRRYLEHHGQEEEWPRH